MNRFRPSLVILLLVGFVAGIAFQKYIGIWQVRHTLIAMLPETWDRTEIDLKDLSKQELMVALTFGQSNAANYGETRHNPTNPVFNFYKGKLYRAEDPLLGANGTGGSVWTILGDMLVEQQLYKTVIFVPIAVGGSEISRWAPGGDLNSKLIITLQELRKANLPVTHLLWHQGEKDALLGTEKQVYKDRFNQIVRSIRDSNVAAPIFVATASRHNGTSGNAGISTAQKELVNPQNQIFPGPDTDKIGEDLRYDGTHFSAEGQWKVARMWKEAVDI